MNKLAEIQQKLKAPKNQYNSFGKYSYRSCEDILEGIKPLLRDCVLTISDEIREIGGRIYVEATATLTDGDKVLGQTKAFAREPDQKKGMDESQITGCASSYARKYALNGLFCIDDTKDADTCDTAEQKPAQAPKQDKAKPGLKQQAEKLVASLGDFLNEHADVGSWVDAAMEDGLYKDVIDYLNQATQGRK